MQAFLLYFLDCKKELSVKLKEIKRPQGVVPPLSVTSVKRVESQPIGANRFKSSRIKKRKMISQSSSMERMLKPYLMNSADEATKELEGVHPTGKRLSKCDINFNEAYTSLIDEGDYDPNNENDVSLLLLLTMMCEIFIFHSLLILQKEDERCEDLYRNEFFLLIKKDNLLPVDFCTDLLIKHKLHSDACKFLFIKNDYDRLMEYIQDFYETT